MARNDRDNRTNSRNTIELLSSDEEDEKEQELVDLTLDTTDDDGSPEVARPGSGTAAASSGRRGGGSSAAAGDRAVSGTNSGVASPRRSTDDNNLTGPRLLDRTFESDVDPANRRRLVAEAAFSRFQQHQQQQRQQQRESQRLEDDADSETDRDRARASSRSAAASGSSEDATSGGAASAVASNFIERPRHTRQVIRPSRQRQNIRLFLLYRDTIRAMRQMVFRPNMWLDNKFFWEDIHQFRPANERGIACSDGNRNSRIIGHRLLVEGGQNFEWEGNSIPYVPHVMIFDSLLPGAGKGLFAEHLLLPGDIIGYYSGQRVDPSDTRSNYQFMDCDAGGYIGHPLALGMHVINDPTLGKEGDEYEEARKMVNVELRPDYSCVVVKPIDVGQEILREYKPKNAAASSKLKSPPQSTPSTDDGDKKPAAKPSGGDGDQKPAATESGGDKTTAAK